MWGPFTLLFSKYQADNAKTWAQGPVSSCRGIIAAGLYTTPFEVALAGGPVSQQEKHSAWDCGTVYNSSVDRPSHNPIVGMLRWKPRSSCLN